MVKSFKNQDYWNIKVFIWRKKKEKKNQIVWNIKLFYVKYILKRKWTFIVDIRKNEGVLLEEKRILFCLNKSRFLKCSLIQE